MNTVTSFIQFVDTRPAAGGATPADCRQFADVNWATALDAAKIISQRGQHGDREVRQVWLTIIQAVAADEELIPDIGLLWNYFDHWYCTELRPTENTDLSPLELDMVFQAFETPAKAAAAFVAATIEKLKSLNHHQLAFEDVMGDPWRIRHAHRERDKRIRVLIRAAIRGPEPDLYI